MKVVKEVLLMVFVSCLFSGFFACITSDGTLTNIGKRFILIFLMFLPGTVFVFVEDYTKSKERLRTGLGICSLIFLVLYIICDMLFLD